jgi:hypothetical protein
MNMDQAGQVSFKLLVKNKQFLGPWLSQLVSNFGDWLALTALMGFVFARANRVVMSKPREGEAEAGQ